MSTALPVEVSCWSLSGSTFVEQAILEGASSAQWLDVLGDIGSGSCELALNDPKATPSNIHEGNLIELTLGGQAVFGYFNEAPVQQVGEGAESKWTLAGQGLLSYTRFATTYPAGAAVPLVTGVYPGTRSWTGATPGTILKTLIDEAQARGTIPGLTYDFTTTTDSRSNAWTATVNISIPVASASLLDVIKKLVGYGVGVSMSPPTAAAPTLLLHAYAPGTQGQDLTGSVIWRYGQHIMGPVPNTANRSSMQTVALVQGSGGVYLETTDPVLVLDPYTGRREGGVNAGGTADPTQLTNAGQSVIAQTETSSQSIEVPLDHGDTGLYEPYVDYRVGDTIALDVPGSYASAPFAIAALHIEQTEGANYNITASLGSVLLPSELRTQAIVSSNSGTTSQVSGTIAGNLTLATPNRAQYVALGDTYIQAVADGSTTAVSIGVTACAEMTALPAAGVVAVSALGILSSSTANTANVLYLYDYSTVASGRPYQVAAGAVAAYQGSIAVTLATGGTNNRQIKYSINRGAGTITYFIRVLGYWFLP